MRIKLKPIRHQVTVVFGASSGIGRQTALDFAKKGAKVVVAARGEAGLYSLVEEIYEIKRDYRNDCEAFAVVADAANFEQVKKVADAAVEQFGRLDTWVHSAGTFIFAPFEQTEPKEFRRLIEVNLLGQVHGAMAALPHLKKAGGALIHLTSVEAWRTVPFQAAYGASKHGIHGFLQALRVELAHDNIPVSVTEIQPAAINTPIYEKGRNKMPFKPRPVPPIYQPKIVSEAILFAAENVTREIIAGGAGLGVMFFERLSPPLTDKITRLLGYAGQKSNEPADPNKGDGLFEPIDGYDTVEGRFNNESFSFDPYTSLAINKRAQNALLLAIGGILGGVLAYKNLSKNSKSKA
ncbi:MAG: SDR family oxidoreductase [Pyrinomonadaceae bacterium]